MCHELINDYKQLDRYSNIYKFIKNCFMRSVCKRWHYTYEEGHVSGHVGGVVISKHRPQLIYTPGRRITREGEYRRYIVRWSEGVTPTHYVS